MEVAQKLDFKLYLEGVPVEFESATITAQVGAPAIAQIRIPPTIKSQNVLPRTSVHLFYVDPNEIYDQDSPRGFEGELVFKLLFEGEVMGISYNKTTDMRSTTLVCSDITNNFDYAHRFVIEDIPSMLGAQCEELVVGQKARLGFSDQSDVNLSGPIARLVAGEEDVIEGVKKLIRGAFVGDQEGISTNEFLESVEDRFRITDRVTSVPDNEIGRLAEITNFLNIMSRGIGKTPPNVTLTQLINIFLTFIFYSRVSILSPSFRNNLIQSFILLPNIYFSPPPKCNVLFPDHIENIGYTDMFLRSPTRLFLQTAPFGTSQGQTGAFQCATTYMAPRELAELLPAGSTGKAKPPNNAHRVLTSEEKLKGIIPVFKSVGQPEYITLLGQRKDANGETVGTDPDSARNYLLNMAEYELDVRKAQTRSVNQMTGTFNPEVVVGAPVAAVDDVLFIFGMLESVTHTISAVSGAATNYMVSMSRRVPVGFTKPNLTNDSIRTVVETITAILEADSKKTDEERSEDDLSSLQPLLDSLVTLDGDERIIDITRRLVSSAVNERKSLINQYFVLLNDGIFEDLPETPRWVNTAFDVVDASDTYQQLYGCDSVMTPIDSNLENQFASIAVAVNEVFKAYKASEDRYNFTKRYTKRSNITNQLNFESFYGLDSLPARSKPYPASGPFTEKRQAPMRDYMADLILNRAHIG